MPSCFEHLRVALRFEYLVVLFLVLQQFDGFFDDGVGGDALLDASLLEMVAFDDFDGQQFANLVFEMFHVGRHVHLEFFFQRIEFFF